MPADRALKAINMQLEALQKLKGPSFDEVDADETEWEHTTHSILEAAYGDPSTALSNFSSAKTAGSFIVGRMTLQQKQSNFQERIKKHEAHLRSLVAVLQMELPAEIQGSYEPGDDYGFYRDLSALFQAANQDILIVDAYLDEDLFNLYVSKVSQGVPVRILSTKIGANVEAVAKMYARNRPLSVRSSEYIHDRVLFLDQRGWVIGQSIKDAARKKPTYLVELNDPSLTASRDAHAKIWAAAAVIL